MFNHSTNLQTESTENHVHEAIDNAEYDPDAAPPEEHSYDSLMARAESFTPETSPEEIGALLKDTEGLDRLSLERLRKVLKKNTGTTISAMKGFIADEREEGDVQDDPDDLEMAREIIESLGKENLLGTTAHVWRWDEKGVWLTREDREVKQWVQHGLERIGYAVKSHVVNGVVDVLKTEIHAPDQQWNKNNEIITFINGALHWEGGKWILKPHEREDYCTTQIPHAYNVKATCPRFIQFLPEIFRDDSDGKDKALLILELIGYSMVAHANFETFVLLIGSGANGKSVLLYVIMMLVGKVNVSAVQPAQFSHKFQRAHLHMKLVNLVTEIAEGGEIADAELKAITSGELTTAEHKNKPPFDFIPYCTCWFGTNHLPHTRDFSDALFRRAKVIQFNRVFAEAERDPQLKATLATEIEGIIALALQAYAGVIQRGGVFTEPASCKTAKQEWRKEADQVAQFIEEKCELTPDSTMLSSDLYMAYDNWTRGAGITRKLNRKNFTNRMERLGATPRKGTKGVRLIAGIRLIEESDL